MSSSNDQQNAIRLNASTVGVIGAGVSGVAAARHLKAAGLNVTVFERSSAAGGVWLYDERRPLEPDYPSTKPSVADFVIDSDSDDELAQETELHEDDSIQLKHGPPGPAYEGLSNNVSTPLMQLKGHPWPEGTEDYVNHRILSQYIQDASQKYGVEASTIYDTRVERVEKRGSKWRFRTTTLRKNGPGSWKKIKAFWNFDAVVVASGHYHAERVPDIPGLKTWKELWPNRVQHSKSYRIPTEFKDQTVLLIGAGVSSTDIARELGTVATKIYQSSRGGRFALPSDFLPKNGVRVGEIASFDTIISDYGGDFSLPKDQSIPGTVTLVDGTQLHNIDRIVVCTGYHCSYPFLSQYHDDSLSVRSANDTILVTDGTQVHNLHKDIFYIPDPTLAFLGASYHIATFSFFEFQAVAIAAVFAGRARLPPEEDMRREYRERVERKGYGRAFHTVADEEIEYVQKLVDWLNHDAEVLGIKERVEGHTAEWHQANTDRIVKWKKIVDGQKKDSEVQTFKPESIDSKLEALKIESAESLPVLSHA
ncbi:MAG: hypothetical protein M1819_004385 [Sarea resinae]|nr:MAG: hypothetical protein M1819_004385 [Sarea resinae]